MGMFTSPFIVIFGVMVSIITIILAIPLLSSASVIPEQSSANLTSTGSAFSALIPMFGILVVGGITLMAMVGGKTRL